MRLRFLRYPGEPRRPPEPTPSEAYVLEKFGDAIAFASEEWRRFDTGHRHADPHWADRFSLKQRVLTFVAGPIGATLVERWPEIAAAGAEADALTETTDNEWVICLLIVGEAIIAAGGDTRSNVRRALPD